jgi:hypothetical protein
VRSSTGTGVLFYWRFRCVRSTSGLAVLGVGFSQAAFLWILTRLATEMGLNGASSAQASALGLQPSGGSAVSALRRLLGWCAFGH